jgi:hypothetical protein
MGAIVKVIPIHSDSVNPLMKYVKNNDKTSVSKNLQQNPELNVSQAMNYAANPLKTICNVDEDHKEILTSGVGCQPLTAAQEFAMKREQYRAAKGTVEANQPFEYLDKKTGEMRTVQKKPLSAIHCVQSFEETDLDPHLVHQIGVEFAERLGVQALVCTHLNKEHLHNHIVINAYLPDGGSKYKLDKAAILAMRELSDDIQREYGISISFEHPREQLIKSLHGGWSYKEWVEQEAGTSWKDQMRQDIAPIASTVTNRADYLSMMESYGYKLDKVDEENAVFIHQSTGKKIRDKTLGKEFTIGELFPMEQKKEQTPSPSPLLHKVISVAKYDQNGRRRSALEMLIRKAIAIVQKVRNFFISANSPSNRSADEKLKILNQTLVDIRKYDIQDKQDLQAKLNETGAKLSHAKNVLKKAEQEQAMYTDIQAALNTIADLRRVDTKLGDMKLHTYTEQEVRAIRAKAAPPTPSMRGELAMAMKNNPTYRLTVKFNELTGEEMMQAANFLNGVTKEQPKFVVLESDYERHKTTSFMDNVYNRRLQSMKERFGDKKAGNATVETVRKILQKRGIEADLTDLSQFDAICIQNCYGANPFSSPLISQSQQEMLQARLDAQGVTLNRPIQYVMQNEMVYLMRYLDGKTDKKPAILAPYEEPYQKDKESIERFMKAKGIYTTVPVQYLSKQEFNKLYSYVISAERTPPFFSPSSPGTDTVEQSNESKDIDFMERIQGYQVDRQLYLNQLRGALNLLRSYGYQVDETSDLSAIQDEVGAKLEELDTLKADKDALSSRYSSLLRIKQTTQYAQNPAFLYGDLYDAKKDEAIQTEEVEERDTEPEPQRETEEEKDKDKDKKKHRDVDVSL